MPDPRPEVQPGSFWFLLLLNWFAPPLRAEKSCRVQSQTLLCEKRAFLLLDKQVCCITPSILQTQSGSGALLFHPLATAGTAVCYWWKGLAFHPLPLHFLLFETRETSHSAQGSSAAAWHRLYLVVLNLSCFGGGLAAEPSAGRIFLTYRCFQGFVFINKVMESLRWEKSSNIDSNHSPSSAWALLQLFTALITIFQFPVLLSFAMMSPPWAASMSLDTQILKVAECWRTYFCWI